MTKDTPAVIHPLPKPYVMAIGELIVQWAMLEIEFNNWIAHFLFFDPKAKALAPKINGKTVLPYRFQQRLGIFQKSVSLCFSAAPTLVRKLETIVRAMSSHTNQEKRSLRS
jgi:hypothetical protein